MPPPGRHARTIPLRTGRTAGASIPIACRGVGTYIIVCNQAIAQASINGRPFGGLGMPGRYVTSSSVPCPGGSAALSYDVDSPSGRAADTIVTLGRTRLRWCGIEGIRR
jgi:hypothetical protein